MSGVIGRGVIGRGRVIGLLPCSMQCLIAERLMNAQKRCCVILHRVSEKNCAKLFLSELCQMSINFNKFLQVDAKMAKIICYINIFHLTSLMSPEYLVKQKSGKYFYITLK